MINTELFVLLLFGHLFGDYLFQNDWMALNKKDEWWPCIIHCCMYTLWILIFLIPLIYDFDIVKALILTGGIFLSHVILDRTHLIDRWFRFTRGRSWKRLGTFYAKKEKELEDIARVVFTAIVQTVADNTIHLLLMFLWCCLLI